MEGTPVWVIVVGALVTIATTAAGVAVPLYIRYRAKATELEIQLATARSEITRKELDSKARIEQLQAAFRAKTNRETKQDALDAYRELQDRMEKNDLARQEELVQLRKLLIELQDRFDKERVLLNAKIENLVRAEASCQKELTEVKFSLERAQIDIQDLQASSGRELPSPLPALVVADLNGTIIDASPAIFHLLGWMAADLIGKNVDMFIPEDRRAKHHEKLALVQASGRLPGGERRINEQALTKDGRKIPVTVVLKGRLHEGRTLISAVISQRSTRVVIPRPAPIATTPKDNQQGEQEQAT